MNDQLFQGTKYPQVYFPTRKPMGIRKTKIDGYDQTVRVMTFKGVLSYGIPKFPTEAYQDFVWVPKPMFPKYFEDNYFQEASWAAVHQSA